ncbi:deacylase [Flavobacteriaceae bacterium AU392]|nr:deacylase [Flavobacteriaceae bacterium AU392]
MLWLLVVALKSYGQNQDKKRSASFFFVPEILIGKTLKANTDFPQTRLQKAFFISIGKHNNTNDKEWAKQLNYPKTGISLGVIDFGNTEKIGKALTIMPFMEFELFKKNNRNLNLHVGLGGSYIDTQNDEVTNPFNRAITTKINWSFRSFIYYDFLKNRNIDWRFGLGYIHHSNGHTRLPNQGLNSLLASISTKINSNKEKKGFLLEESKKSNTKQTYFSIRTGVGQNVLSEIFNDKKEVYSLAISAGKIINKTFKFGGGIYYRFYEHYYDYIRNGEALVQEQFPFFEDNPYNYATNYGVFGTAEILIDHFGFELDLGVNIFKPFYRIAYQLTEGFSFQNSNNETVVVLGELDSYFEIKRTISSRLGLKYYMLSNNKAPKHNLFIGVHINANLGQADFTELSFGYVRRFSLKK